MAYLHRRAPNPYDVILGTRGFMLARDPQTQMPLYQQQKMQSTRASVTPAGAPYALGDPSLEVPRGFFNFRSGMGHREEADNPSQDTNGYYYGLYIAVASGDIMNGPAVTSVTPSTTGNIRKFFELNVGGTRKLCAVATRYVLVRDADTASGWVVSRDLGVGATGIHAEVFRGAQTRDTAFIAMDSGTAYWTWDGTSNTATWTQDASNEAIAFATYRDRLIKIDAESSPPGYLVRVTYNGGSAASWGGPFVISDLSNPATDMAVFNNRLYVGTERGLFAPAVADSGAFEFVAEDLTPAFRYQRNSANGRGLVPWYQFLFVPMGNSLFRYDADGSFDEMGLGALERNSSEVQGVPTAMAGYRNWCLFASFYNAAQNASYLMQWGDWQMVETANGPRRVFVPGWYGALYKFSGVQINAMFVTEAPGGNPRLYLGTDTGVIHYIILPRYSMDWRSDANCFLSETRISLTSEVIRASRRSFEGDVTEITTAAGNKLTGTPNHPILTDRGWIALGKLKEGDNVISHCRSDGVGGLSNNVDHMQPTLGQIFDLALVGGTTERRLCIEEDFHGDGRDGKVDVVLANGHLRDHFQAATCEHHSKDLLAFANMGEESLSPLGPTLQLLPAAPAPLKRIMSSGSAPGALLGRNPGHRQTGSITLPTKGDASMLETIADSPRIDPEGVSNGKHGLSSLVTLDKIVHVKRISGFKGHVYNLETKDNLYFANGILTHNCVYNTSQAGQVFLPGIHMGIPHEQKANTAIAVRGDNLASARYIDVTYRTNTTEAFGGAANLTDSGRFNSTPGDRKDFTTSVSSRIMELLATLTTTTAATPVVLKAIAAYEVVRPTFRWVVNMTLRLGDNIINRDGHLLTRFFGEEDQFDSLEAFTAAPGLTRFISPRGEDFNVLVENLQVQAQTAEAGKRWEWLAQVRLLQQQSVLSQVAGTYGRIESNLVTYGGMENAGSYGALKTA